MTLHAIGYLAKLHGVSASTIRRWEAAGLIEKAKRTLGGHRRFSIDDGSDKAERKVVGYARVSSYDQKEDLQRQVERLKEAGCEEVLSDIGGVLLAVLSGVLLYGSGEPPWRPLQVSALRRRVASGSGRRSQPARKNA